MVSLKNESVNNIDCYQRNFPVCTVAVMSSVADMSSDVIEFTEPIISCVLSNNTQHKTGN